MEGLLDNFELKFKFCNEDFSLILNDFLGINKCHNSLIERFNRLLCNRFIILLDAKNDDFIFAVNCISILSKRWGCNNSKVAIAFNKCDNYSFIMNTRKIQKIISYFTLDKLNKFKDYRYFYCSCTGPEWDQYSDWERRDKQITIQPEGILSIDKKI